MPNTTITQNLNITHIITAFANSSLFLDADSATSYDFANTTKLTVADIRATFEQNVKVCMAIGGWADGNSGFETGSSDARIRTTYATNVATTMKRLDYDCVGTYDRRLRGMKLRNQN